MTNVFSFEKAAAKRKQSETAEDRIKSCSLDKRSNFDLYRDAIEDVMGEWQSAASKNKLSEYIFNKLPPLVRGPRTGDYVNDLNLLSTIENKLNMVTVIYAPGATSNNAIGWMATFHRGNEVYGTLPDLASEGIARSMNIVLFLVFGGILQSIGRI